MWGTSGTGMGRARASVGLAALAIVPVLIASVLVVPVGLLVGVGPVLTVLAAVVVGLGVSAAIGPVLVGRRIERLPDADLEDRPAAFIEDRVAALSADLGIDAPAVTVVRGDAANVAVTDGYRGARLVVSTRLLSLPAADRDAALRHALVRVRSRDAAVTTALLPAVVVVETLALLATLLVGRRNERTASDRRVNRIHGYEPERERIPAPAYTAAGVLLWLLLVPVWIPAVVGDRLYVAERRRAADASVARLGPDERTGLANAVEFARDAAGAADWPPLLDRLSLVSMADEETGRVRGTSRQETRVRLARLRSKRSL
ncbi:hypothetical protein [Halorubrum sp. DTA98]|uniref:hypothetical protein n=1 Tax=Halorubrum sp. DTA98 TaxID=3402163 RepID=UPI003AB0D5A5